MMNETITIEKEQLTELLRQNRKMKEILQKANNMFQAVATIMDIKEGAEMGNLMLKIPKALKEVKRNPEMFTDLPQLVKDMEEFI